MSNALPPDDIGRLLAELDPAAAGAEIYAFVEEAYPIGRSLTGDGVRRTLEILGRRLPLEVHEVASGTQVFDWQVPDEWNVREAWIKDPSGAKVVDYAAHNLHLLGYSTPVAKRLPRAELEAHLYSLPEQPDLIPYRTSYYQKRWGFCLSQRQRDALPEGEYEVLVDATLEAGHLTYGELLLPGETETEVLFSAHVCHPSLANDNLSGVGVCATLARLLSDVRRRYSYRFVFAPGTVGAITWLARNRAAARRIGHGLVAANLGDGGEFHFKRSRRGDTELDRAVERVLADAGGDSMVEDFVPFGYDERQYCSPGFDLAVGSLTRTPWGRFPEYHTSADDLELVRPRHLGESLARYLEVVHVLESNRRYRNLQPECEPQLGRRGLYGSVGGAGDRRRELALLWVLNQSDGEHSLLDIACRAELPYPVILAAARDLQIKGLINS